MITGRARVFTAGLDDNMLERLAEKIRQGFPCTDGMRPELALWTILLPTRRAVAKLQDIFATQAGRACVLPRIVPIGDLDGGDMDSGKLVRNGARSLVARAIAPQRRLFLLLGLVQDWAQANPHLILSRELAASQALALALAESLCEVIEMAETEERPLQEIARLYDLDLATHRQEMIDLLALVQLRLPQILRDNNLIGPGQRRNLLIRHEAERIRSGQVKGPIVAAGSTGTNPATRDLLAAVAQHPQGAVVLPHLDTGMDDGDWQSLVPTHPQYGLAQLLKAFGLERGDVETLIPGNESREVLVRETMRPAENSDAWSRSLKTTSMIPATGIHLIEAQDRHDEARLAALILRKALEQPGAIAGLITPDRDLAQRVKSELQRWNIVTDDSGGEPLALRAAGLLLDLLLACVREEFSAVSLLAVLHHPLADCGLPHDERIRSARFIDVAVLRGKGLISGIEGLSRAFAGALHLRSEAAHFQHMIVQRYNDDDWQQASDLITRVSAILSPLADNTTRAFRAHLARLTLALRQLSEGADWSGEAAGAVDSLLASLDEDGAAHPDCTLAGAAETIARALKARTLSLQYPGEPRVKIYGLLEARMMPLDVAVLGGLNEGKWPAAVDTGPWLNRSMRGELGLQPPERDIGLTGHDFSGAMAHREVYLTWSKRLGDQPANPSRWILRLEMVLRGMSGAQTNLRDLSWQQLATRWLAPTAATPLAEPQPRPAIARRPSSFSVTEIETLIRDPYAIFAWRILNLQPLEALMRDEGAKLRGSLFHVAMAKWNALPDAGNAAGNEALILRSGQEAFAAFSDNPDIMHFWWPRFERAAQRVAEHEETLRKAIRRFPEIRGVLRFDVSGRSFTLRARADRIDLLENGAGRIIDFKSGTIPSREQVKSGLAPQLPLEAAILQQGGFAELGAVHCYQALYVGIAGKIEGDDIVDLGLAENEKNRYDIGELASQHFASLISLLGQYEDIATPYRPRHAPAKDGLALEYDHLSRHLEWSRSDGAADDA